MSENILAKLFEHNNWANLRLIEVCENLTKEQLDATPQSVTKGSIRETMRHLVAAQRGYLALLTIPANERKRQVPPGLNEWMPVAKNSGEGLIALVRGDTGYDFDQRLQTSDGYYVYPWVVLTQAIDHAAEHREQIKSMLNAQGVTPPNLDGWAVGEETNALIPISD